MGQNSYTTSGQSFTMDAAPFIVDGRALVPVRYLATAIGATTAWDNATQTVTVASGSTTISVIIGSAILTVNGQSSQMDVAPVIRGGRPYLPIRYIAEFFDYTVSWNAAAKIVTLAPPSPGV
jgi:N-acetylmuramoyl-L-alanine amidase